MSEPEQELPLVRQDSGKKMEGDKSPVQLAGDVQAIVNLLVKNLDGSGLSELQTAFKNFPEENQGRIRLADILQSAGLNQQALQLYEQALLTYAENPNFLQYHHKATVIGEMTKIAKAICTLGGDRERVWDVVIDTCEKLLIPEAIFLLTKEKAETPNSLDRSTTHMPHDIASTISLLPDEPSPPQSLKQHGMNTFFIAWHMQHAIQDLAEASSVAWSCIAKGTHQAGLHEKADMCLQKALLDLQVPHMGMKSVMQGRKIPFTPPKYWRGGVHRSNISQTLIVMGRLREGIDFLLRVEDDLHLLCESALTLAREGDRTTENLLLLQKVIRVLQERQSLSDIPLMIRTQLELALILQMRWAGAATLPALSGMTPEGFQLSGPEAASAITDDKKGIDSHVIAGQELSGCCLRIKIAQVGEDCVEATVIGHEAMEDTLQREGLGIGTPLVFTPSTPEMWSTRMLQLPYSLLLHEGKVELVSAGMVA